MERKPTKLEAEALLRTQPSVLGAYVREDVYGRPREVHVLVGPGAEPRRLAGEIRDLLEHRLGVPIDQRIISIAQMAEEVREEARDDVAGSEPWVNGRLRFGGLEVRRREGRVTVEVLVFWQGEAHVGEATEVDVAGGSVRAAAAAGLRAVCEACGGALRLEPEAVSVVPALGREYVLASVLATSPALGRRPLELCGAQPVEGDPEAAGVLAVLNATNRIVGWVLGGGVQGPRSSELSG